MALGTLIFLSLGLHSPPAIAQTACTAKTKTKKMIQMGWDVPDAIFLRDNITSLENAPVDGIAFHLNKLALFTTKPMVTVNANGVEVVVRNNYDKVLYKTPSQTEFPKADLLNAVRDTQFCKFTDNFVYVWWSSKDVPDWFNDAQWQVVLNNTSLAIDAMNQNGKVKGLWLDLEHYGTGATDPNGPFNQAKQIKLYGTKDYQSKVWARGREFMNHILDRSNKQQLTIMTTFLTSVLEDGGYNSSNFINSQYGLIPHFLSGMLQAINTRGALNRVKIVDGNELAYYYDSYAQFQSGYNVMKTKALTYLNPIVHPWYSAVVKPAHGLYMDRLSNFVPFADAVASRLNSAYSWTSEYVWMYTERPSFYSKVAETYYFYTSPFVHPFLDSELQGDVIFTKRINQIPYYPVPSSVSTAIGNINKMFEQP